MTAAALAQEIRALPAAERAALTALLRDEEEPDADAPAATATGAGAASEDIGEWSAFDGSVPVATVGPRGTPARLRKPLPDFAARVRALFPEGIPGPPASQLLIESRDRY